MNNTPFRSDLPDPAEGFRAALVELVELGMGVARLVGTVAEGQRRAAAACLRVVPVDDRPATESMEQAIAADRALEASAVAVAEMPSVEMVVEAFARVSRSVRMTVLLAERLDRGWARRADDRAAMERRQAERVARVAEGDSGPDERRAERLDELRAERLEELEDAEELGDRPDDEVLAEIHRGLGLNPLRQTVAVPPGLPGGEALSEAVEAAALPEGWTVQTAPWSGGICVPTTPWDRPPARDAPGE